MSLRFFKGLILFNLACIIQLPCYGEENPVQELQEVTVIGEDKSESAEFTRPTVSLSGDNLRRNIGQTLGETLQSQMGISSQSFGAGVGTPVIRGQTGSRVKVLQNSLGNNDLSSLSPDHANGVDPIIAERIEVVRGPSTLMYGSGAIGGIVNVIDNRIPEKTADKLIGGAGEQRFDSATEETSTTLKLEGGKNHFVYHLDGFYRDQNNTHIDGLAIDEAAVRKHDPSFNSLATGELLNSNGVINNTQGRSRGGSAGFSFVGDGGFAGAAINQLDKVYGIPPDGHGEAPISVNLMQTKYDVKGQLNQQFAFAEQLRMKFGYTDYRHVEMDGGIPGTTFLNQTYESRLELQHQPIVNLLTGMVGFQTVNSQFEALGEEGQIVPKSTIDSYTLFDVESLKLDEVQYQFGVRAEGVTMVPHNLKAVSYVPISGSASATWDITNQHQLGLAFTHSQRAPQIQELFTDGFHHATRSYEIGNSGLAKEISNNLDLSYSFHGERLTAEIKLFHNWTSDYIYQQRSTDLLFNQIDSSFTKINQNAVPVDRQGNPIACDECFPVLNSRQAAAIFKGFEAEVVYTLMQNDWGALDLTLFGDYTRGTFNSGGDVPRLPPLRYGLQLSYEQGDWSANARLTRGEAQTQPGSNETETDSYLLLNVGGQYRLADVYGSEILLFAKGKNLLNENIRNSTSYLRNFAPEPGRSGEIGIRVSY